MKSTDEFAENTHEDEDLIPDESPLNAEESAEFQEVVQDLLGLTISLKIEADAPMPGAAEQLAHRIRVHLGHPGARIQAESDGLDAALSRLGDLRDDDLEGAVSGAKTALGGTWSDASVMETSMGPLHYVVRERDEAGAARVHLWAGSGWALVEHIEAAQ
ncbi:hypothetical protein [Streptomyces sp. NPDC049813]|uniref:hypothetical protein n=1 Tax=Streptomyces sp. NPDC049813 TaxID=3365597 RepID=UPI00379E85F1